MPARIRVRTSRVAKPAPESLIEPQALRFHGVPLVFDEAHRGPPVAKREPLPEPKPYKRAEFLSDTGGAGRQAAISLVGPVEIRPALQVVANALRTLADAMDELAVIVKPAP